MPVINVDERWLLPDGTLIDAGTPFTLNEMQYLNGVAGLSKEQVLKLGIVKMAERPDETLQIASPDLDNPGQWITTPRPAHEIIEVFQRKVEDHIEAKARERGYSSAVSCASYLNDPNPVWTAEAQAFIAWRSAVWTRAFELLADVQSGKRAVPTIGEMIAELPSIEW